MTMVPLNEKVDIFINSVRSTNTTTYNNDKPFNKLVATLATAILQPLYEKANTANPSSNPLLPPGAGGTPQPWGRNRHSTT